MKAVEIIRNLLDLIDQEEQQTQQPVVVNINNGQPEPTETAPEDVVDDNVGVFVPPLQQKLELMKKSQGVESVYDQEPEEDDEVTVIKRMAGIAPINVIGEE